MRKNNQLEGGGQEYQNISDIVMQHLVTASPLTFLNMRLIILQNDERCRDQ